MEKMWFEKKMKIWIIVREIIKILLILLMKFNILEVKYFFIGFN